MLKWLEWLASWQNALSILIALAATIWLGPFEENELPFAALVFVAAFAAVRVILPLVSGILGRGKKGPPVDSNDT